VRVGDDVLASLARLATGGLALRLSAPPFRALIGDARHIDCAATHELVACEVVM
jgi:hypothetical protein